MSTASANTDSPVKQFNKTVKEFVSELKNIFGPHDKDINTIEMACDMTRVNVRLIITPFQQYVSGNPEFVKNIMEMNVDYFLSYDYESMLRTNNYEDDYNTKLIKKFRDATRMHRNNQQTVESIFNWFKVMMYHSYKDQGKDPKTEMTVACNATKTSCSNIQPSSACSSS